MATFQPADNLRSRTFLGLLVAQFLAAFNDQAIHASAMFFAINKQALNEAQAISLMPILFYAPWAIFCTLAGFLADRYSKRSSLVFWKVAEIAITLVALAGFWLGTRGSAAGPWVVLSTVFLMGMHSAFFVPAKYGAMPEILQPQMLSRGNGVLESLSFLAVILGTVCGGILSTVFHGSEYFIGIVLVALAVVGAVASLLINPIPAANPDCPFPRYLYGSLYDNVRTLLRSRPLAFAVIGIAFFTFIVAFMRATVYLHGEVQSPPWTESKTSEIVGMVALGIGLGSPFVGFLSGGKVELGLVPVGAIGMIVATLVAAATLDYLPGMVACIALIGFFTGFYIVPLFTLLQQRAPKMSKGELIATSNLINVTGAIIASLVVYSTDLGARVTGVTPAVVQTDEEPGELTENPKYDRGRPVEVQVAERKPVRDHQGQKFRHQINLPEDEGLIDPFKEPLRQGDRVVESRYDLGDVRHHRYRREGEPQKPVYDKRPLPRLLFVGAASMTLLTLLLLTRQMPDLFVRTALWLRLGGRYRLNLYGANNLPSDGPVVLVSNAARLEPGFQVLCATDRTARFVFLEAADERPPRRLTLWFAAASCLLWLKEKVPATLNGGQMKRIADVLVRGEVLGLPLPDPESDPDRAGVVERAYAVATGARPVPVVPVCYESGEPEGRSGVRPVHIIFGTPLPAGVALDEVREAVKQLGADFHERHRNGPPQPATLSRALTD
jgi:MFS family permease